MSDTPNNNEQDVQDTLTEQVADLQTNAKTKTNGNSHHTSSDSKAEALVPPADLAAEPEDDRDNKLALPLQNDDEKDMQEQGTALPPEDAVLDPTPDADPVNEPMPVISDDAADATQAQDDAHDVIEVLDTPAIEDNPIASEQRRPLSPPASISENTSDTGETPTASDKAAAEDSTPVDSMAADAGRSADIAEADAEAHARGISPTRAVEPPTETPQSVAVDIVVEEPVNLEAATAAEDSTLSLMERLLNENDAAGRLPYLEHGQAIEGMLMQKDRDEWLIDVGTKSEGVVPSRERQSLSPERTAEIKVGDNILVVVVRPESGIDGIEGPLLSIDKARTEVSWRKLSVQYDAAEIFDVAVIGYNKGGLMVDVEGVRGFIPSSQVNALANIGDNEEIRQSQMARMVGSRLTVKIVEVNRDRNRLILSEKQAVRDQREANKGRLLNELEAGQVREGSVTTLTKFGAFIDLGGVDGLVHVSELSWSRVDDPKQVLSVGQMVKVFIMNIDQDKQKVQLSIKRTQPEPWTQVTQRYHVGELVDATITQLATFGAFARLDEGVEGLIHISELAEGRVEKPSDIVKQGEQVKVRILKIDAENKRLALSLKRANEPQEAPEAATEAAPAADNDDNASDDE